jgi:hypothetical protein
MLKFFPETVRYFPLESSGQDLSGHANRVDRGVIYPVGTAMRTSVLSGGSGMMNKTVGGLGKTPISIGPDLG